MVLHFVFPVCSDLEFREVANRLRDWFKALHESGIQNKKTRIVQRPERTSKRFLLVLFDVLFKLFCALVFPLLRLALFSCTLNRRVQKPQLSAFLKLISYLWLCTDRRC